MDKPRSFIHLDRRAGYEVLVIGRAAIPFMLLTWLLAILTVGFFLWGLLGGFWGPLIWLGICCGAGIALLIAGVLVVYLIEITIDVNRKENI